MAASAASTSSRVIGNDDRPGIMLAEEGAQEIIEREAVLRLFTDDGIGAQPMSAPSS